MRPRIALVAALLLVVGACTSNTRTQTLSLVKEIEGITIDANRSVADLFDALAQPYDNRAQLYERLLDLRLPGTFAILHDKAGRVEAPPGTKLELDRYVDFLAEMLLASERLDLAIATEDPAGVAIAAIIVEVAVGALAVALPTSTCIPLTPHIGRDLCDPGGLEGYEAGLGFELRRFIASFRPAFRVPETFGDVIRGRVLATLQIDAARVLSATASRISALDPGTAYVRIHEVLLEYFPTATEAWAEFEADTTGSDPLIYGTIIGNLEAVRETTQNLLEAQHELILSALPNSQIVEITDLWFGSTSS
ncbi:MAG: hypothetical protein V3S62_05530 [Acidimicrobiia bacterium]